MRLISPRTLYCLSSSSLSPPFLQISHFSTSSPAHHFHSNYSFRRHDEDVRNVRISVWWDFENCHLPAGVNVFKGQWDKGPHSDHGFIRANGIKGPIQITAFGDMLQLSRANQEALSSTGVNLTHVPHGGKNSADRSLLVDLMYWVSQNPPPAHLFLISGDRDFASILHRLRMNNYNILLASPENAPGVLCSAASIMWPWHALLTGENLTGKYFNQPPDGPYGSWYGHYKVPLEDPYSVVEPPAQPQTEKLSEPGSDSKPRPIPTAVMKQIRQILKSHPKGISITDLRMELGKCNLSIDRDFYGYKKFSRFLSHILNLQSLGDGKFLARGGSEKSSEPCQSNLGMSTESIADNGGQDLSLASRLDCEHKSINVSANRKLSSPASHESNVEDPNRELQQPFSPKSDGKSMLPPSPENVKSSAKPLLSALDEKSPSTPCTENVKTSVPIDGKVVEVAKEQDNELHFPPAVAQGSSSEVGYFKWIWRQWFGYRGNVSGTRSHDGQEDHYTSGNATEKEGHDTPVKQCTSVGNSGQRKDKEKLVGSTSQVVDQAPHVSSSSSYNESDKDNETATSYEVYTNKSKTSQGFFEQIVNWCKFWRSSPCSDKLSDQSCDRPNLMNTHSQEHMLFSKDSFWRDMGSFMDTPKGSVLASESRTREQMALNLQKEGPLFLRSLCKSDLVHLVDLLISEKKWVEESPSQTSPFKLTYRDGKSSLDHSNDTNRLTSIFLNEPSQHDIQRSREHDGGEKCRNIPHSGVSLPAIKKKPSDRCRIEIIADCQKLVNEILKEYPEGYNMALFRKLFLDRYGYHLDLHMLGYQKLSSLLQMMPGVKVESSYIIPACKTPKMFDMDSYVRNIQKQTVSHTVANSDSELSDASTKDDVSDSPWEELGPVANTLEKYEVEVASRRKAIGSTGFDYEPSLSDGLSDSEGETSPLTELEGEGAARVNKEDSSLLQILDSWYSGKDGRSSKERSENFEGLVDFTNVSKLSVSSGVGPMNGTCSANKARKQRPQKNYSFVADSGDNKDKLFDGIVGSLKKSSEPRMKS
ncbi:PREDICTED: endonuclease or glycosyl [Prunus dulcis]|uniref:PREDICTED: endonuclease or glycosyl n=1 Tax=Prunus dulcis TaxID=3755 RepID=A0A5E4E3J5_PRUDU|nr:PREDICTED: endonuclease or glycosyl [Prunus dulcis]